MYCVWLALQTITKNVIGGLKKQSQNRPLLYTLWYIKKKLFIFIFKPYHLAYKYQPFYIYLTLQTHQFLSISSYFLQIMDPNRNTSNAANNPYSYVGTYMQMLISLIQQQSLFTNHPYPQTTSTQESSSSADQPNLLST